MPDLDDIKRFGRVEIGPHGTITLLDPKVGNWTSRPLKDRTTASNTNSLAMTDNMAVGNGADILLATTDNQVCHAGDGNDLVSGGISNDSLYGDDGDDVILGGQNEDKLYGGAGQGQLLGGSGNDTYVFEAGNGSDRITETDSQGDSHDVLQFSGAIQSDQLWFRQINTDLEISVLGTNDKVTVRGWYADQGNRLESTAVDRLVQAMATLPANQPTLKHLVTSS
jgi:Ca2+-binding RTX toxin-like protein